MAEETGQERTEEPTANRLSEARKKGQLARSRELTTVAMLLAASGYMLFAGDNLIQFLADDMRRYFTLDRALVFDPSRMTPTFMKAVFDALMAVMPLFVLMFVVAALAPLALGGWSLSAEAIGFKWERLDPIKGIKKIFAWRGVVELIKALIKFSLVIGVAVWFMWRARAEILGLGAEDVEPALAHSGALIGWSFILLSAALIVVALVDVPFQLWDYKKQLRMTRQEVKDDNKQTEGSPEVRGRIRQLQREMAKQRMMQEVPKADVIVTNPTHYAIALRYDAQRNRAPMVVAKGADLIAGQIRQVAAAHGVTIVSAPPLARAIYHSTDLNREIPAGLYLAVAQVLAYVYQLRQRAAPVADTVTLDDLPIPEELRRDG